MGGSLLKNPNGNPPRKQSSRLRAIDAIYESEDVALRSKLPQQTSENSSLFVTNLIKVETLLPEWGHGPIKPTDESYGDCDDQHIDNMTLKDLQTKSRAKKRKFVRSVVSTKDDFESMEGDLKLKIKEEESDLDKPLICLKWKPSKLSVAERRRRKCAHNSSTDTATDLRELKTAAGTAEENSGIIANNFLVEINVSSDFIDKHEFLETFQKVSEGESGNDESIGLPGKVLHSCTNENPELLYNLKSEVIETDSVHESTVYIAVSSNIDFIAKYDHCENSSSELLERVDGGELENGGSTSFTSTLRHCCVNQVSCEYMEPDKHTYHPEIAGEHLGEIRKMDSSGLSSHEILSFQASEHKTASSDVGSTENHGFSLEKNMQKDSAHQLNYSAIDQNHDSMEIDSGTELNIASEDLRNFVDEVHAQNQPQPIPNHKTDEDIDHILLCKEMHDLGGVSKSSMEVEHLDDFVEETVARDAEITSNSIPLIGEHSTTETNNTCSTKHPRLFLSAVNDSHAVDGGLPKTDKLLSSSVEQMSNGYRDTAIYPSTEISNSIDAKGLAEALHCHPHISSLSRIAVNGSHHSDDKICEASKRLSSSTVDISHSVDSEGQDLVKEFNWEPGMKTKDPPRKILSNRKTFSPDSQEMLCQALNGNDLNDAIKLSGYMEGAAMLGPERMIKRPKSNRNCSLRPVTKGILKSPDSSCSAPCSCMNSSLFHMKSEEAIRFSLRQMHDIKSITTKLLKGLDSMKNILEETLCSEAWSFGPSKFTTEEIRLATEHASELESTTNKWLSIMSRDCNRFCKIMRSTENKAASPVSVRKDRRRITFADEAGGSLCHVKVFDQQPASPVLPGSELVTDSIV